VMMEITMVLACEVCISANLFFSVRRNTKESRSKSYLWAFFLEYRYDP
jgi:hypothetical protein